MKNLCVHIVIGFITAAAVNAAAMELTLDGTRLTLRAEGASLKDILQQFSYKGVRVKLDPAVSRTVTVDARNREIEEVLEKVLQPYGYVLLWDVIASPFGDMPRLAEIQVFRRGHEMEMIPLYDPNENLQVRRPADAPPYVEDEILLAVRKGTSLESFKRLLAQIGGTVIDCAPELGVYRVRFMPGANVPALVAQLTDNDMVHTAEPNYIIDIPPAETTGSATSPSLRTVQAPAEGAAPLAILDSGLTTFDALADAVVGAYDAVNPERALSDPMGHGTQMALVGAGAIDPSGGGGGGAGTPIIAVRAFDDNGVASNFGIMRSIEYALAQGARVVNMSWGSPVNSEFLATAAAYAQSKGLILVASAGNDANGKPLYPAAYPGVVAVAATAGDSRWEQSNYGDFVTLAAPGEAEFPVGYKGPPGSYAGTSIASVFVARALAQYLSLHPDATKAEAMTALQSALTDAGDEGRDDYYGFGILDESAIGRLLSQSGD